MMRKQDAWLCSVLVGALITASAGNVDATLVTIGDEFPTIAEVIAATPAQGAFGQDALSLAQSFTVDSPFSIQSIFVEYENDANAVASHTLTMSIFAVADVQATNLVANGPVLFSDSVTFPPPASAGTDTIARIDLDTLLPLAASVGSAGYAIEFTAASVPGWEWLRSTATTGDNVYVDGKAYQDGLEKSGGTKDFVLAVSSVIPEPSSLALLLIGAVALVARRSRS